MAHPVTATLSDSYIVNVNLGSADEDNPSQLTILTEDEITSFFDYDLASDQDCQPVAYLIFDYVGHDFGAITDWFGEP